MIKLESLLSEYVLTITALYRRNQCTSWQVQSILRSISKPRAGVTNVTTFAFLVFVYLALSNT